MLFACLLSNFNCFSFQKRNEAQASIMDELQRRWRIVVELFKLSADVLVCGLLFSPNELLIGFPHKINGSYSDYRCMRCILRTTGKWRSSSPSTNLSNLRPSSGIRRAYRDSKAVDDNYEVIQQLASRGNGRVLVIDGSGGMRTAFMGSLLAGLAQKNGWSGVVVNGYIRDVDEINGVNIGVRALGSYPVKPSKKGGGEKHVPVYIGGTWIRDGEWLYADSDGILVSKTELSVSVVVNHAILFNNVNVLSDLRLP